MLSATWKRTGGLPAALIFTRAIALRSGSTRVAMIAAASSLSARCLQILRCVTYRTTITCTGSTLMAWQLPRGSGCAM
jgi:hypothetical protein